MKPPIHTNKTDNLQKQRMCVGNAETRCGRGVNDVLFTAVSKGAQRISWMIKFGQPTSSKTEL
ncbi:MAG: hypothetical protein M0P38_08910 [Bacteroidales bacterium]|nr:hypothetical protein [Bacteroidales bacterium]